MTDKEAMTLALYGLEIGLPLIEDFGSTEQFNAQHKAISAIYEALAQPKQTEVQHLIALVRAQQITIDKLEAALAQPAPVQEPVDFEAIIDDIEAIDCIYRGDPSYDRDAYWMRDEVIATVKRHASFYTTPPQRTWVGLTEEEIGKAWAVADGEHNASASVKKRITRAIEAKLKEKINDNSLVTKD